MERPETGRQNRAGSARRSIARSWGHPAIAVLLLLAAPVTGAGQDADSVTAVADSVTVVAGPRYVASPTVRTVLGHGYRSLWTTPIRVPLLHPDTFAGGLVVLQPGSSASTQSLRFQGADGRQYVFRSVDKEQRRDVPEDLARGPVGDVVQDLVAAKHPGAALVVAPLLDAAGVLHAAPRLAVMADHSLLGEHRTRFAGMLGTIEERPDERGEGDPDRGNETLDEHGGIASPFDGYTRIIGSDRLLERIAESPVDRVEARAYLTARLVDVLVGDWDRHPDQWRWAGVERDGVRHWLPIPRDRDNALSSVGGWIAVAAPGVGMGAIRFGPRYEGLYLLLENAAPLDRRILAELPLQVWEEVALELRQRITDEVIDRAVGHLPREWMASGVELGAALRSRRDELPTVARALYRMLSSEVDVHATDAPEIVDVHHAEDGSVRVRLYSADPELGLYFDRRFVPGETREVRIHLSGGADRAVVHGRGGGIAVRLIGGAGDDALEDLSRPRGGTRVTFHVEGGADFVRRGWSTRVDRRSYSAPSADNLLRENAPPPRDWGAERSAFTPHAGWRTEIGPVVGGGPTWTRYGFRRAPYDTRAALVVQYAPLHGRVGAEGEVSRMREGGRGEVRLTTRATALSLTRFHGFGNETPDQEATEDFRVWSPTVDVEVRLFHALGRAHGIGIGTRVEATDPQAGIGRPVDVFAPPGRKSYGLVGVGAGYTLDRRSSPQAPTRGGTVEAQAIGYPATWGDAGRFLKLGLRATGYLPLPAPLDPVVALRFGGEHVEGDAPFQHAAFLGGGASLRGFRSQRYAGQTAVHGSAELRTTLARVDLRLARGVLGALVLGDAGRVFVREETSDRWHTAAGGGLWFSTLESRASAHVLLAFGERMTIHLGTGMPF